MKFTDERIAEACEAVRGKAGGEIRIALLHLRETWSKEYHLAVSLARLYTVTRDVRPRRSRRADAGRERLAPLPQDQVEYIKTLAVKRAKSSRRVPAAQDLIDETRGIYGDALAPITPRRLSGLLRKGNLSIRLVRQMPPTAIVEHEFCNDQAQMDATTFQFYFRPDAVLEHPDIWMNKNRQSTRRVVPITVLSCVDSFSRIQALRAYIGPINSWQVKHFLFFRMRQHGIPRTLYTDKDMAFTADMEAILKDMGCTWIGRRKGKPGAWKRGKVESPFGPLNRAAEASRLCPWEKFDALQGWIQAWVARKNRVFRNSTTHEIPEARFANPQHHREGRFTLPSDDVLRKLFRVKYEPTVRRYRVSIDGEVIALPWADPFRLWEGKKISLYLLPWDDSKCVACADGEHEFEIERTAPVASPAAGLVKRDLTAWEKEIERRANEDIPLAHPRIEAPPSILAGIAGPSAEAALAATRPELTRAKAEARHTIQQAIDILLGEDAIALDPKTRSISEADYAEIVAESAGGAIAEAGMDRLRRHFAAGRLAAAG